MAELDKPDGAHNELETKQHLWEPILPGEELIKDGKTPPKYAPEQVPETQIRGILDTDSLIIWDQKTGNVLAAFNLSAHNDQDEGTLNIEQIKHDLEERKQLNKTDYMITQAIINQKTYEEIKNLIVGNTSELGIKTTSDYIEDEEEVENRGSGDD